jgi:ABC-type bacteriocin/lantibiotic exporter with double-glycine peptidase domain
MFGFSIIIIFYIVKSLFLIYLSYRQSKFTAELSVSLSNKLYKGYIDMDYISFTNKNTSDLIKNIQTEILYFGGISLAAMALCTEISAIFGISLLLILIEPNGSLIIITFFGLFSFLFNKLTKKRIKKLGIERQNLDQITSKFLYEGISGSKEIKLLGVEDFFYDKFAISNFKKSKVHAHIQVLNSIPRLYLELLAVFGISLLEFILSTKHKNSMGMIHKSIASITSSQINPPHLVFRY